MPEAAAAIVSFAPEEKEFPAEFPAEAKELVIALLQADLDDRLSLRGASTHAFYGGLDVFELYRAAAPELVKGAAAPQPEAGWARRNQSMLWQPMPGEYASVGELAAESAAGQAAGPATGCIAETASEAGSAFVSSLSDGEAGEAVREMDMESDA